MTEVAGSQRLGSWRPGPTRNSILEFVDAATELPVGERVAVFDNDGTLWAEKPNYVQLLFMLDQLQAAVKADPSLADRSEYRALIEGDKLAQASLGLPAIAMALVELCAGWAPEEFTRRVREFVESGRHSDRDVPFLGMRYRPMLELIAELRAHEFSVFVVTGGGTEFVRAISEEFYGVEPERVVGTQIGYDFAANDEGIPSLARTTQVFGEIDEGAAKVVNLQNGLGRRPILAAGNSPGDTEMLEYAIASDGPSLALLVDHDDEDREYRYTGEAGSFASEGSLPDFGRANGWTVVSMANDWESVFEPTK